MRAPIRGLAVAGLVAALVAPAVPANARARHAKPPHAKPLHAKPRHAKPRHAKPSPRRPAHETAEHALVHWINVQRHKRGLRPLVPAAALTRVAHQHTKAMVARRKVWHDSHLGNEVTGWLRLGEDVGRAGSLAALEYALLHTPANRVNILGPGFQDIGVGTGGRAGSLYVTVLVRQPPPAQHH